MANKVGAVAPTPWYSDAWCKIHLDMHCPEWDSDVLHHIEPETIVRTAAATGADALYFFAKDHYGNAYYPTQIGHVHACIGDRDLVKEILAAGKRAGLPIVLYYSVVWDIYAGKAHPDWCQRTASGETIPNMDDPKAMLKWLTLCHNTPYRDYMRAMLEELARTYDADGFHLDMFHLAFGRSPCCYCDTCRALFKEQYHSDLPTEGAWDATWRQFLEFRFNSVQRLMDDLVGAIHAIRPGIFVTVNYHGSPGFNWSSGQRPVQHAHAGTVNTGETYTPALGELYPGMEGCFLRGIDPAKHRELVCWRMNRITDYTNKPLVQFRWEALTAAAHGASVMVIDQPYADGSLDMVAYDRMRAVFEEMKAKRETYRGTPLTKAAIYYSAATRDHYGRREMTRAMLAVTGCYKAMVESHVPVDFVFDETVTGDTLKAYAVLCLPNVAILSDGEASMIRDYVRGGGTLIATYDTSRYNEMGEPREDFLLADLFGVSYESSIEGPWHFWRILEEPFGKDIDPRYFILNDGAAHGIRAVTAQAFGELYSCLPKPEPPERFFSHAVHPPDTRTGACLYVNRVEKGTVYYLPHPVDAAYANEHELPEHRLLLRNIVASAAGPNDVEIVEAPLNTEAVILKDDGAWRVHLLTFNPTRQARTLNLLDDSVRPSQRMDEAARIKVVIEVNRPFSGAEAFSAATRVRVSDTRIEIECDDVHEVITIKR